MTLVAGEGAIYLYRKESAPPTDHFNQLHQPSLLCHGKQKEGAGTFL